MMRRKLIGILRVGYLLALPCLAWAETLLVHLAPSTGSPVITTIDSSSPAWQSAADVEGQEGWKAIEAEDHFSGFVTRESLQLDETVRPGTEVRMTPSERGQVLTIVEEGDQVKVNLVDDWTEITIRKVLPGFVRETPPLVIDPSTSTGDRTYGTDPLLEQLTASEIGTLPAADTPPDRTASASAPAAVAASPEVPVADTMTPFENVDRMNPAFRTSGVEPAPVRPPSSSTLEAAGTAPSGASDSILAAPLLIPAGAGGAAAPTEPVASPPAEDEAEVPPPSTTDVPANGESVAEEGTDEAILILPAEDEATTPEDGQTEAPESSELPAPEVTDGAEEAATNGATVETPATIVQAPEDVEVVVEPSRITAVVPQEVEANPRLVPPSDTNRNFVGRLTRTNRFLGIGPKEEFQLVDSKGDRIAFVDLRSIPIPNFDAYIGRIVNIHGRLEMTPSGEARMIRAAQISYRR